MTVVAATPKRRKAEGRRTFHNKASHKI